MTTREIRGTRQRSSYSLYKCVIQQKPWCALNYHTRHCDIAFPWLVAPATLQLTSRPLCLPMTYKLAIALATTVLISINHTDNATPLNPPPSLRKWTPHRVGEDRSRLDSQTIVFDFAIGYIDDNNSTLLEKLPLDRKNVPSSRRSKYRGRIRDKLKNVPRQVEDVKIPYVLKRNTSKSKYQILFCLITQISRVYIHSYENSIQSVRTRTMMSLLIKNFLDARETFPLCSILCTLNGSRR